MNVAMVSHYFASHRGGVEIVARQIAEGLASRHALDVTWVASASPPPGETSVEGLTFRPVPAWNILERAIGIPFPVWPPASLSALFRCIANSDVVVLQDTLYPGNIIGFLMARILGRPVLVIQHISLVPYRNRLLRLAMRCTTRLVTCPILGRAQQVVFISRTTQDFFRGTVKYRRPDRVIHNGVDTRVFRPCTAPVRRDLRLRYGGEHHRHVFLFVGRFVEKKGLNVLRRLAQLMPRDLWNLVGWGSERPEEWGLENVKVYRDLSGDTLVPLYQAADLFVLPSVGEGFPLVVQEAMACGTPVLCGLDSAQADPEATRLIHAEPVSLEDIDGTGERWRKRVEDVMATVAACEEYRSRIADFAARRWSWDTSCAIYADVIRALAAGKRRASLA